jgi:hypothetical protein
VLYNEFFIVSISFKEKNIHVHVVADAFINDFDPSSATVEFNGIFINLWKKTIIYQITRRKNVQKITR